MINLIAIEGSKDLSKYPFHLSVDMRQMSLLQLQPTSRQYDAARWLRKIVGVVCSKDLPANPSEEDFGLGLRSGIILCTTINKVQPGIVPKVVAKLHSILRPFLLRGMKADVELTLPRKKEIILYAIMTEPQNNYQDHLINRTLKKH